MTKSLIIFQRLLRPTAVPCSLALPSIAAIFFAVFFLFPAVLLAAGDKAIYWSIMDGDRQVGYLLGTIHSEDPRVLDFPEPFLQQLESNQVFAMELVPDLPTLTRLNEFMHYQDGTSLESQLGPERFTRVRKLLSAHYQVPADWLETMKVWAVVMTLSIPPPETGFFMDFSLSLRASGSGLRVVGLETLDQQLAFLEDMPARLQLELLDQALVDYDRVGELHTQMVDAYLAGDLQVLKKEAEEQMEQLTHEAKNYFIEQGIDARNHRMLESLLPLLAESSVFAAVGALHLPGEQGLIALLRKNGYILKPEPLPLASQGRHQPGYDGQDEKADAPNGLKEQGGHTQHGEHQSRGDAVTDPVHRVGVAAGQFQQQVVQADFSAAMENQWQQDDNEEQR